MAKHRTSVKCAQDGCGEYAHYTYDGVRDLKEGRQWRIKHPFRCSRHTNPEEILSLENLERTTELVSTEKEHGKYFGIHGFIHGTGYRAWADDFPVGTKIIVTAKVILPEP